MDGNLEVAFDVPVNFVDATNQMFVTNDYLSAKDGTSDPRHLMGVSNFDVFRFPGLVNGRKLSALATFITTVVVVGIPLVRTLVL